MRCDAMMKFRRDGVAAEHIYCAPEHRRSVVSTFLVRCADACLILGEAEDYIQCDSTKCSE